MLKAYYAHCLALYHTPQEDRDIELLENCGFIVINPSSADIEAQCKAIEAAWHSPLRSIDKRFTNITSRGEAVMELVFRPLLTPTAVDVVVFRSLPDGRIPAGVAKEITWAEEVGIPILELPSNRSSRLMTVEQTREYLKEIGQR